ncbi:hypothetical protein [Rhodovulum sulfidophilum]|uniref:hypothetical protein n=1 Tax=Rhodovulum sulfidophilum TaxID=35806 RepID=UPI001912D37B|nr:hypothetical protein [Rhodovulum sulfidophilum]
MATQIQREPKPMLTELTSVLTRCRATLWQDAAGAAALMVLLIAGLHLPGLV